MKNIITITANLFYRYFNLLFSLVIAGMYANALIFPNMGVDAAYYLRVTECIADGAIPEYDLRIFYPPMVFYMLLPVKIILGKTVAYQTYLGIMFLIQLFNACFINRISRHYSKNNFVNILLPLLYLFLSIKLEGEYFFLEPFINFWGLLAVFIYLKYGQSGSVFLFLSGFIVLLSFLAKQYGLAFTALIFLMILIDNKTSVKRMIQKGLILLSGVLAALFMYIILFRLGYGVWYDFLYDGRLALYGEKDLLLMLKAIGKYFLLGPFLILLLIPGIFRRVLWGKYHLFAWLIFLGLLSYQFYLNQYEHYYMLVLPPILIMGGMILGEYLPIRPMLAIFIILLSLFINEYFVGRRTKNMILSSDETLSGELILAKEINEIIPPGSNVYIFGNVKYYYLCHLNSAIPEKYGYSYSNILTVNDLVESIYAAEYVVVDMARLFFNHQLIDDTVQIGDFIRENNLQLYRKTDNFLVYSKISKEIKYYN